LLNLKIIAMLRQHEKFRTQNNTIVVDKSGTLTQGIHRWILGESRMRNLQFIREIYNRGFLTVDRLNEIIQSAVTSMQNHALNRVSSKALVVLRYPAPHLSQSCAVIEARLERERILQSVKKSLVGLINLKTTYEHDFQMVASIQILIEEIEQQLLVYQQKKNTA